MVVEAALEVMVQVGPVAREVLVEREEEVISMSMMKDILQITDAYRIPRISLEV